MAKKQVKGKEKKASTAEKEDSGSMAKKESPREKAEGEMADALEEEVKEPKAKKTAKKGAREKEKAIEKKDSRQAESRAAPSPVEWVEYKPKDVEELVVNLANAGHSASEIGAILRDQHGIPKAKIVVGKTISKILEENKLKQEIPEDLLALIRKAVALDTHLQQNKKDFSAKRGYELTVSKIRRLVSYYHNAKRLPADWRYNIETARLLMK